MKPKKNVVIKIGTAVLTQKKLGSKTPALKALVAEIAAARKKNWNCIIVSSGAIGLGLKKLGMKKRPTEIPKKQAAAAVGQVSLMADYQNLFARHGITVAQILLTRNDLDDHQKYLNIRNTLQTLLQLGIVPIINENDTVATEEIRFGDNDQLSALVASKMDADLLILLSNVDGLLRSRPGQKAEVVTVVAKITNAIENLAWQGVKTDAGTGGMTSKIQAAKIASTSGVTMVIASALRDNVIADALTQKNGGTWFLPKKTLQAKQKWILFAALPKGKIILTSVAAAALKKRKKNLISSSIASVEGVFRAGDVLWLTAENKPEMARGISEFSSTELEQLRQNIVRARSEKSKKIAEKIVVRKDNLILVHR